jgi:hypothetical protein
MMISGRLPSWFSAYRDNIAGMEFRTVEYETRRGDGWVCMWILRGGGVVELGAWFAAVFASEGTGKCTLDGRLDAIRYDGFRGLFLKG